MHLHRPVLAGLGALSLAALAACGSPTDEPTGTTDSPTTAAAPTSAATGETTFFFSMDILMPAGLRRTPSPAPSP